ncbi:MAG TPA: terminase family protein [Ktedonobacterales bacterium]|nr:terminase family protein [Ktedonobacterales bacterium]
MNKRTDIRNADDTRDGDDEERDAALAPRHFALSAWTLNPEQWAFVACPRRFCFFVGGIGSGKTYAGAARAVARMRDYPKALGLIGAPTYAMLRDTTIRAFLGLLPAKTIAIHHKSENRIVLDTGAEVLFRSLDEPDRLRGLNLGWFWLDEAPLCGYYAWEVLKGRLRQRGVPTAGWATGTPHGRDGYYRDFEVARRPTHALFRASTYTNLHNLPFGYIEELGYTGAFAEQEIEGRFTAFDGLVYTFDATPAGHLRDAAPDATWQDVIGGIDWGYTNPAAALVFGVDGDRRAWQLAEFYQRRASLEESLLPAIVALTRRYGVRRWYCGPDEPEHIEALAAALTREGLACRALRADNAVRPGIQTVTSLLAPRDDGTRGLYVSPSCVHTIAEYGSYQYASRDGDQRDPSEQPIKQNDHALDATRYALHTALSQRRGVNAYLGRMRRRETPSVDSAPRDGA